LGEIEETANKIVREKIEVRKKFYPRNEAEKKFGMRLYQGGAVPGKNIRVVEIKGKDAQACGGTHLNNTGETGKIRIIKASKIQDGIVRITFTAGKAAERNEENVSEVLGEAAELLGVEVEEVPGRARDVFEMWKKARKAAKKGIHLDDSEFQFGRPEKFQGDVLQKTAEVLQTQKEHVVNTLKRFLKELEEMKEKIL